MIGCRARAKPNTGFAAPHDIRFATSNLSWNISEGDEQLAKLADGRSSAGEPLRRSSYGGDVSRFEAQVHNVPDTVPQPRMATANDVPQGPIRT